jgi:hypothetical protein
MSDASPYVGGGFSGSSTSPMSDDLRIRMEAAESIVEAEVAKQERDRRHRAEILAERAQQAAIQAALAEGQVFSPRMLRGEGLGHRPADFIAQRAATMDIEDAHAEAERAAEYRRWQAEHYASTSADTSAPTPAEAEANRLDAERSAKYRDRIIERRVTLQHTQRQAEEIAARGDRRVLSRVAAAAATALSSEPGFQSGYRMDSTP